MKRNSRQLLASARRRRARLEAWRDEASVYWRESVRPTDFVALMRVRLSQSKVGRWVTPDPIRVTVDLETLGPSVTLRSHTTDISVLKELLVGDSYEPLPADRDVETVIDLGSNIGLSYRWLRARYPRARFVCVEPDAGNLELLRANVRAVDPDAVIHGVCIGGRERRVKMATTSGEWGFRMTDLEGAEDGSDGGVDVMTMDALLEDAGFDRIGVLKCDIEGAEAEVFADCRSWIDRVDAMSVECHNDKMTSDELLAALAANGGEFRVSHLEANPHLGFDIITLVRA
jgi:FkbM family methyltransferase